jgi:hypothetical protein
LRHAGACNIPAPLLKVLAHETSLEAERTVAETWPGPLADIMVTRS